MKYQAVATLRLQDKPAAQTLLDQIRSEGRKAWMTMDLGPRRYGGSITVHAELPKLSNAP